MPAVCIARHAETTWNVTGRYQGRLESELSALGLRQAQALSEGLRPYDVARIICSPLERCLRTAQPISERFGIPVETDARLIEIAHGTWEGRYRDELAANDAQRYKDWRGSPATVAFENGENLRDVRNRWIAFVNGFDANRSTLIVSHDAVVRLAILERTGRGLEDFWQPSVLNAGFAYFDVLYGTWNLRKECVSDHLRGLQADISAQAL